MIAEFGIRNSGIWNSGFHATALAGIVEHARDARPLECCGLLVGSGTGGNSGDSRAKPCGVADAVPDRSAGSHQRDPRCERCAAWKSWGSTTRIRIRRLFRLRTDRAEAGYPDHLYFIASLASEPPENPPVQIFGRELSQTSPFVTDR